MSRDKKVEVKAGGEGIGFSGLLTIAFIVLKLCKIIDWPWIWVVSPLWIGFAIVIVLLIIFVVVKAILKTFL